MDLKKILVFSLSLFLLGCADRELYDSINEPPITGLFKEIRGSISGKLLLEDSPYKVTSDLTVPANEQLIIEPGVEIYFTEGVRMIVNGGLIAEGNYYKSILFAAYDQSLKWKGIKIYNSTFESKFDYAYIKDIREPGDAVYFSSSISLINSKAVFIRSFIYENSAASGGGIGVYDDSELFLTNSILRDNSADLMGGAVIADNSSVKIINNTFYQNSSHNSYGGVYVASPVATELQNNIFFRNTSRLGNIHYEYASSDSSTLIEGYNFMASGNMDPQFYTLFDLRLFYLSPCRDAGNPAPEFKDYNGSRNDQGAYGGPLGYW